ncbi:MAG: MFS transporter [Thermoleophilaceae bacterium]|nr:MFS transporter [Thermoleophilaceae bacterium]
MARRGVVAGCALGMTSGWNFGNLGGIASELSRAYGVGLAAIGLLTTAMVVTHLAVQIPGGKASDRFGPARAGAAAMVVLSAGNALALARPDAALAIAARAMVGVGTGLAFVSGSALVRESGGSPLAQGVFGGLSLAPGGVALAVVPQLEDVWAWRAPYWTALVISVAALVFVWTARPDAPPPGPSGAAGTAPGVVRDRRLYRLAVLYTASYGLGVVLANWVVELLRRHSALADGAAAAVGALTLVLVVLSRPLGGWILRAHPERARRAVAASIVAGVAGTLALVAAEPVGLAVAGALLVGLGAGVPFSPAFTGAAVTRPDAPAAAVGFVNTAANLAVLVGTPLVGLSFSLAGEGRLGFAALAALWLGALAVLPSRRALGVDALSRARS